MSARKVKYYANIFAKFTEKIDKTLFDKVEILKEIKTLPIDIANEIGKFDQKSVSDKTKEKLKEHLENAFFSSRINYDLAIEIGKFFGKYYKQREGDTKWLFDLKNLVEENYEEQMEYLTDDDFWNSDFDGYGTDDTTIEYENVISIVDRTMQKYQ